MFKFHYTKSAKTFFMIKESKDANGINPRVNQQIYKKNGNKLVHEYNSSYWLLHTKDINNRTSVFCMNISTKFCVVISDISKGNIDHFEKLFFDRILYHTTQSNKKSKYLADHDLDNLLSQISASQGKCAFEQFSHRRTKNSILTIAELLRKNVHRLGRQLDNTNELPSFDSYINSLRKKFTNNPLKLAPNEHYFAQLMVDYHGLDSSQVVFVKKAFEISKRSTQTFNSNVRKSNSNVISLSKFKK